MNNLWDFTEVAKSVPYDNTVTGIFSANNVQDALDEIGTDLGLGTFTDNRIIRADGTSGMQDSLWEIIDDGSMRATADDQAIYFGAAQDAFMSANATRMTVDTTNTSEDLINFTGDVRIISTLVLVTRWRPRPLSCLICLKISQMAR